jgi:signal transduction histidine kinase
MTPTTSTVPQINPAKMTDSMKSLLRNVPILASLQDSEMHCLEGVQEIFLQPGEILAAQGETAHFFWIQLEGELQVFQVGNDGQRTNLYIHPAGSAYGEVPLLANQPNAVGIESMGTSHLLQLNEDEFWHLMTACPEVRKAILKNMAVRMQKIQVMAVQNEKMASLGTMAAGLMHELNNPGAAARRAATQLRENLMRLHELTARFSKAEMTREQKQCMFDLQDHALSAKGPSALSSLEQSDAEEALAEWLEAANVENAWKIAPTLAGIGLKPEELECARSEFPGTIFSDALSWLEALTSSMQLVGTIEESIGRVTDLVHAVKSYAYEGRGQKQEININESIHATLVILGHKMREKEIVLEKNFAAGLPLFHTVRSGLNQIWTNLLDNAIDAVPQRGRISIKTWAEAGANGPELCIAVIDNGSGIPATCQAHIFDPFFTTKAVGVGTGLGLGIVNKIVEHYGGVIHFTSSPGETEFVVRLPADAPVATADAQKAPKEWLPSRSAATA